MAPSFFLSNQNLTFSSSAIFNGNSSFLCGETPPQNPAPAFPSSTKKE